MNYEPGSVFKLNGKEYVLSENHTLDIPVFVNAEIEMPAKISKITIVITSATNVIPFEFLNVFFIF